MQLPLSPTELEIIARCQGEGATVTECAIAARCDLETANRIVASLKDRRVLTFESNGNFKATR